MFRFDESVRNSRGFGRKPRRPRDSQFGLVAASGFLKGRCGLVVISGFFGTGWLIWLQVRLLFPEIVTNSPPKP